ncbi:pilus assembly protein FimV [Methylophilus rhizosphaerae]|uniref:Pilus assembly protein FimV n=1 Tax=Methylophilus rhizosphaerae TaxID=492660 RepID=A0A1G8Z5X3_9PROT|nr:FimV/HubP family polar landmark protein [Methylophilus rhizosphaerae]SDK09630.1 pilus assembly protein FimV [Methylophilus rhizosphaerae]
MSTFQLKKLAFTLSLGLSLSAAITAYAAGLGSMTSSSKLGEPLNAEIELLAVAPGELNSIQAALASDQVYQDQMLEKPASYPYINIAVGNNSQGQPVLKLTSSQPITEAFLDMLVQVDWPTGRLVKEYTLLLDPPGFNSNYVSEPNGLPVAAQPVASPEAARPEVAPALDAEKPEISQPLAKKPSAADTVPSQPSVQETADNTASASVTTARGDTLYAIARQMKPDNVSMEQMLAALYQSNQGAFDGKNMNRLKVGKIIRLPDQATLNGISRQQANHLVVEHTTHWLAYKNALSNAVKNADAHEAGGNTQQSAGKIGSAQEKTAPQAAAKDVLKLSAGDEKSGSQTDKASANAAKEEAIAKENAIKEEQSRAAALEKQVADMKKLVEMKNNAMAQAEQNAAQTQKNEPKTDQPSSEKTAEPAPPAAQTAPAAEPVTGSTQPSFMKVLLERLKHINPVLPWALIALPILICIWALIRIRRKKEIDTFEDAIMTSPATEMQNNTVFGDTQAASGDTSFLTDFSQSGVGGMIDSHDVDPIAEAEVYMAYGRDAQAEEILKDAIQKDPERQELKLKLLEIYQSTGNKAAFESLAGEVYSTIGSSMVASGDQTWTKVVAMGQKLDPENALYQMPALDNDVPIVPVTEAQNEEAGYHFNFETPALEFDAADTSAEKTAISSVIPESSSVEDSNVNASEDPQPEMMASLADPAEDFPALPETPVLEMPAEFQEQQLATDLAQPQDPGVESTFAAGVTEAADAELDSGMDAELTPKALDLPSLNLDEGMAETESNAAYQPSATGEQTLSSDDAVFESLPELSLELGAPNAINQSLAEDDPLLMEEVSLETAGDVLNDIPVDNMPSPVAEFPEISLDMGGKLEEEMVALDSEPEEVNTKLDLIQAYIDMEDMIGAKELIEEVMSEGGERQRQRASELLAKVA